jgi:mRNA interferase MazF
MELWFADLNPVKGIEQKGVRPFLVVSRNAMNNHLNICIFRSSNTKIKNLAVVFYF